MSDEQERFIELASRIDEEFGAIDSDINMHLQRNDSEYFELFTEYGEISNKHTFIEDMEEGTAPASLNADEIAVLTRYMALKVEMIDAEHRAIYLRGHADCISYLKMIGVI